MHVGVIMSPIHVHTYLSYNVKLLISDDTSYLQYVVFSYIQTCEIL